MGRILLLCCCAVAVGCGGGGGGSTPPALYSDFSLTATLTKTAATVPILSNTAVVGAKTGAVDAFAFGEDEGAPPVPPGAPYVTVFVSPDRAKDIIAQFRKGESRTWTVIVAAGTLTSPNRLRLSFARPVGIPISVVDVDGAGGTSGAVVPGNLEWDAPLSVTRTWRFNVTVP